MLYKTKLGTYIETSNITYVYVHKTWPYDREVSPEEKSWEVRVLYVGASRQSVGILLSNPDTKSNAEKELDEICADINVQSAGYEKMIRG